MRARARVVAEADGTGGTRLAVCYGEAPLLPRRTGPPGKGPAQVHVVGGAAGPLGRDDLLVEVVVGPGAHLRLHTVAATIVLSGRTGPSRTRITAGVAEGGRLDWLPEPLVATAGCDHTVRADVDLAADAVLTWRDELICGRTGEQPGDLIQATVVRRTGRPLSHQELRVGPSAPGWAGPAGLGGHRAVGSVLLVGLDPASTTAPIVDGARGSLLHLAGPHLAGPPVAGPAALASAIAVDAYRLRKMLTAIIGPGHDTATGGSSV